MKPVTASVLLATLALTGTQLVCAANSADTPINVPVNYASLDLSTSAGVKILYRRLNVAAGQACEPLNRDDLSLSWRYKACIQRALSNAVRNVDNPMLTQHYAERSGELNTATVAFAK
jgi:UrcA family protein